MKRLLLLPLILLATSALASQGGGDGDGGDQVKNPWQNVPEGTCTVWSPDGLTVEVCVPDPEGISGRDFLCTFATTCPDGLVIEDPEDPEDSEDS